MMMQKKHQRHHHSMEIIDDLDASQTGKVHGLQGKSQSMYTLDMSDDDEEEEEEEDGAVDPAAGGDEKGRVENKDKLAVGREGVSTVVLALSRSFSVIGPSARNCTNSLLSLSIIKHPP